MMIVDKVTNRTDQEIEEAVKDKPDLHKYYEALKRIVSNPQIKNSADVDSRRLNLCVLIDHYKTKGN